MKINSLHFAKNSGVPSHPVQTAPPVLRDRAAQAEIAQPPPGSLEHLIPHSSPTLRVPWLSWFAHLSPSPIAAWLQAQPAAWEAHAARSVATKELALAAAQLPDAIHFQRYFHLLQDLNVASADEHRKVLWALATPALSQFTEIFKQTLELDLSSPRYIKSLRILLSRLSGGELPESAAAARTNLRKLLSRHHPDKLRWDKFTSQFDLLGLKSVQELLSLTLVSLRRTDLNEKIFAADADYRASIAEVGFPGQARTSLLLHPPLLGAMLAIPILAKVIYNFT